MFIERTAAEAEALILWLLDAKSRLIGKDADARKDWGQEEKGVTEDEMDGIVDSMDMSLSKLRKTVKDREAWHAAMHGLAKSWIQLSHWTATVYRQKVDEWFLVLEMEWALTVHGHEWY